MIDTKWKGCNIGEGKGEIHYSLYKMREELDKRNQKKKRYQKICIYGMLVSLIPLGQFFFFTDFSGKELLQIGFSPLFWLGIFSLALSYGFYQAYYLYAKEKYDALKEELVTRIAIGVCSCWGCCDHEQEFLEESEELYGLKLYHK